MRRYRTAAFWKIPKPKAGPRASFVRRRRRRQCHRSCETLINGIEPPLTDEERLKLSDLHVLNFSGIQVDTPEGLAQLRAWVAEFKPIYLGLDPMIEFHSQPENDSTKLKAKVLSPVRNLVRHSARDCLAGFSHHTRKIYSGQDSDPKQTARGSSAIKGWAD